MNETRRNVVVGAFALVGLIALGALIVMFSQESIWVLSRPAYTLWIHFDRAAGIRPGTQVTVHGIPVGNVRRVVFASAEDLRQGVKVEVAFDEGYRFHEGTRAEALEPGLGMGRPPIRLTPGPPDGRLLASGSIIDGDVKGAVESLLPFETVHAFQKAAEQVRQVSEKLVPVLDDLHELLQPRTPGAVDRPDGPPGNLSSAMARLDASLRHFNEVLGDPQVKSQVRETVANLHAASGDARAAVADLRRTATRFDQLTTDATQLVRETRAAVRNADDRVTRVARKLEENLDTASGFLRELHLAGEKLNRGEGTLGRLLNDDKLYDAAVLTFGRLAELLDEMAALMQDWREHGMRIQY